MVIGGIDAADEGAGIILGFYNTENHEAKAEVGLHKPFRKAMLVDLNEEELRDLRANGEGKCRFQCDARGS